jgi:hypothetical protein
LTAPFPIWVLKKGIMHRRNERRQRLGKLRAARRGAQHDEWPVGSRDHGCGAFDGHGRRNRKLDDMRGNDFGCGFVGRDILGQFEMHRARPLLLRDPEGVANQGRNTLRGDDLRRHLGERPHGRDDVDDLEARLTAAPDRLLSCDQHHRHRAQMRVGCGSPGPSVVRQTPARPVRRP